MSQSGTYLGFSPSKVVLTITGNTGGAVGPTAGNINLDTAHSTVLVAGNPGTSTLTVDFGITNLLLGTSGSITSGTQNVSLGDLAAASITSGSANLALGYSNLASLTTGIDNISIGALSGSAFTSNESSNIIIGSVGVIADQNTIRIGTQGAIGFEQNLCFIAGITGVNVGSVANVVSIATGTGQLGTTAITAGTGITVTPGANTITISTTGGIKWSVITVNQTAAVDNGYICNKAGTLALALPAASAVGDMLRVTGINTALGWQITQSAGQQIFFGTSSTTLGATGTLTSSAIRDSIEMVCVVANLTWNVISSIGNITVV